MKPRDLRKLATRWTPIRVTSPDGRTWTGRLLHYRAGPALVIALGPELAHVCCLPAAWQVTVLHDNPDDELARLTAAISKLWHPADAGLCARLLYTELRKDQTP